MSRLPRLTDWWGVAEWACMLLITPFLLFPTPNRSLLLLVIPALWVFRRWVFGQFAPCTPVDIPVFVLLLMGGVGFCVSPNPGWSQLKMNELLLGVGFLYATVDLLKPAGWLRWVPSGVVALSFGFVGLGLIGTRWELKIPWLTALLARLPGGIAWLPEGETFFNPNVIGEALLWTLPLSLSLLWWAIRGRTRNWGWAAAEGVATILSLGLLVLTQARGAWLGFAAGFLALFALAGGRLKRVRVVLCLVMSIAFVIVGPMGLMRAFRVDGETGGILSTVSMGDRLEIWLRAQYAVADFPLTGTGLDVFQYVMPVLYPLVSSPPDVVVPHAHNEFLQVALDLGLPGLVAWLALYIVAFWMLWRAYQHSEDGLAKALALGCVGVLIAHLVCAMTECGVLDAKPNIVFWMVIGLSVALHRATVQAGRTVNTGTV